MSAFKLLFDVALSPKFVYILGSFVLAILISYALQRSFSRIDLDNVALVKLRRMIWKRQSESGGSADSTPVSVGSYNILAPCYTPIPLPSGMSSGLSNRYVCDDKFQKWDYRKGRLAREIELLDADLVGLQEVQQDCWFKDLYPALQKLGYSGFFTKKNGNKIEGLATIYKTELFEEEDVRILDFNTSAASACDTFGIQCQKTGLLLDQVASFLLLKHRTSNRRIIIGNVHIHYYWLRPERQAIQVGQYANFAESFSREVEQRIGAPVPYVLVGDYNTLPATIPYDILSRGNLSEKSKESLVQYPLFVELAEKQISVEEAVKTLDLELKTTHLRSAYKEVTGDEPAITNLTGDFEGCLDYIMFSSDRIRVDGVLDVVKKQQAQKFAKGCPNVVFPSDHWSIKACFSF